MTETMGRLYLIRHAPSDIPPGQIAGRSDVDARLPAPELLERLAARLPQAALIWASPARRCQQTAAALDLEPSRLVPQLWEQDFGTWEGQSWQSLGAQDDFWCDPVGNLPPGGESFLQLWHRVRLTDLEPALGERDVVLVIHAGPIRALVGQALGLSPDKALGLAIDPLSLSVLVYYSSAGQDSAWSLERLNERNS